jgi:hypothetical protein
MRCFNGDTRARTAPRSRSWFVLVAVVLIAGVVGAGRVEAASESELDGATTNADGTSLTDLGRAGHRHGTVGPAPHALSPQRRRTTGFICIQSVNAAGQASADQACNAVPIPARPTASAPVTLSLTKNGAGSGTVTSTPGGIDCGTTCSQTLHTRLQRRNRGAARHRLGVICFSSGCPITPAEPPAASSASSRSTRWVKPAPPSRAMRSWSRLALERTHDVDPRVLRPIETWPPHGGRRPDDHP